MVIGWCFKCCSNGSNLLWRHHIPWKSRTWIFELHMPKAIKQIPINQFKSQNNRQHSPVCTKEHDAQVDDHHILFAEIQKSTIFQWWRGAVKEITKLKSNSTCLTTESWICDQNWTFNWNWLLDSKTCCLSMSMIFNALHSIHCKLVQHPSKWNQFPSKHAQWPPPNLSNICIEHAQCGILMSTERNAWLIHNRGVNVDQMHKCFLLQKLVKTTTLAVCLILIKTQSWTALHGICFRPPICLRSLLQCFVHRKSKHLLVVHICSDAFEVGTFLFQNTHLLETSKTTKHCIFKSCCYNDWNAILHRLVIALCVIIKRDC